MVEKEKFDKMQDNNRGDYKNRIKELPFNMIIPNVVTLLALSCGVTAMRWAVQGKWELAVVAIILAAIFDGLDGRVARLLQGTSKFGAELDSLSDFVSFGVAPAFIVYHWAMLAYPKIGWILALMFAICCALRLARFNTMLDEEPRPPYWNYFFVGLPAPGGAMVAIAPLMLYLYEPLAVFASPWFVGFFMFLAAILMASRIPTICIKKLKIPAKCMPLLLVSAALYVGCLFTQFWLTMSVSTILYLMMTPFGGIVFAKMKKSYERLEA